jgi:hypothetical protein
MLEHKLRMRVAAQQDGVIIEPGDDALQFHTVDQKNSDRRFVLANIVQENLLNVLIFIAHLRSLRVGCCWVTMQETLPVIPWY